MNRTTPKARHRWARRVGVGLLALLLVTAAIVTWLVNDTEGARRAAERFVSRISHRPFTIEGDFDFELGRIITVRASKIRWSNSSAGSSPYMLEAGEFTGSIDLFSLLVWPIVITDAHVSGATLLFEWDEGHNINWQLVAPRERIAPLSPLPLVLHKASLDNVSLRFQHPSMTEALEIVVLSAQHQRDEADRLVVTGEALLEDRKLAIEGKLGPFPQLAVASAVDFDFSIEGPLARFSTSGSFSWLARLRDPDLVAELTAPSAEALAHRLKLPLETAGAVQMNARIVRDADVVAATASGSFGEYEIDAEFRTDNLTSLKGLDATIRSRGPSIRRVGSLVGLSHFPDAPYELDARALQSKQGIELERFRLKTTGLNIDASGTVRAMPQFRDIDLTLSASGSDFSSVAQLFETRADLQLPFQLNARVTDSGPDYDDLDATLKLGSSVARMTGSIGVAADFAESGFQVSVDSPDANQLTKAVGFAAPAGAALHARTSVSMGTDRIDFNDVRISVADSNLVGAGWLERKQEQPVFGFQGKASGSDLAHTIGPLVPPAVRSTLPQLPFAASTELRLTPAKLDIASLNARIGKTDVVFSGLLGLLKHDRRLSGNLSIRTESIAELLKGIDAVDFHDEALDVNSRVQMSPGEIKFDALSLRGEHVKVDGTLVFTGKKYSRLAFDLTGSAASMTYLIPATDAYKPADVPFRVNAKGTTDMDAITMERFRAQLGDTILEFSGDLRARPTVSASGVELKGSGPRLSDLGEIAGIRLTDRPFRLSASVQGDASGQLLENLKFESAENNLRGSVRFLKAKVPTVEINVVSSKLNLDEIRIADEPTEKDAGAKLGDGPIFSNEPLPFEILDKADGEVRIRIDELISDVRRWRDLEVELSLNQGVLKIRRARVDAAKGTLDIRGEVKPAPGGRAVHLDISAAKAMLVLEDMSQEEIDRLPRLAIASQLSAVGNTPQQLAASLDGFVWIVGGEGQSRRSKLSPLIGDFLTELLQAINPIAQTEPYAKVECLGMYFEIANGKVDTSPAIAIQTDRAAILAEGKVDLVTEKIDFTFETTPRKGIGVSVSDYVQPFTKLEGTLSSPELTLNPTGTVVEGGAAVATLGLSILAKSLWKSWFGGREVCKKVADKAVEARKARDPGVVPDMDELIAGTRGSRTI